MSCVGAKTRSWRLAVYWLPHSTAPAEPTRLTSPAEIPLARSLSRMADYGNWLESITRFRGHSPSTQQIQGFTVQFSMNQGCMSMVHSFRTANAGQLASTHRVYRTVWDGSKASSASK